MKKLHPSVKLAAFWLLSAVVIFYGGELLYQVAKKKYIDKPLPFWYEGTK